jgi:hypothetical protein
MSKPTLLTLAIAAAFLLTIFTMGRPRITTASRLQDLERAAFDRGYLKASGDLATVYANRAGESLPLVGLATMIMGEDPSIDQAMVANNFLLMALMVWAQELPQLQPDTLLEVQEPTKGSLRLYGEGMDLKMELSPGSPADSVDLFFRSWEHERSPLQQIDTVAMRGRIHEIGHTRSLKHYGPI